MKESDIMGIIEGDAGAEEEGRLIHRPAPNSFRLNEEE